MLSLPVGSSGAHDPFAFLPGAVGMSWSSLSLICPISFSASLRWAVTWTTSSRSCAVSLVASSAAFLRAFLAEVNPDSLADCSAWSCWSMAASPYPGAMSSPTMPRPPAW